MKLFYAQINELINAAVSEHRPIIITFLSSGTFISKLVRKVSCKMTEGV